MPGPDVGPRNGSSSRSARVLVATTINAPFVLDDVETLGRRYDVELFVDSGADAARRLFRRAARFDVTLCWFASVYSFFAVAGARFAGKRSVIQIGGVDAANDPELGYGLWQSRWRSILLRRALAWTDAILAVDESLIDDLRRLSHLPIPNASVLPTGYDADFWTPSPGTSSEGFPRERSVLCVATAETESRWKVKGLDLFVELAASLPEVPFTLVGLAHEDVVRYAGSTPPNLSVYPKLPRAELLRHYRSAKVYCLPSRREGLPNALCEAMLCGCVPVAARAGGAPKAVGAAGFVVEAGSADLLRDAVLKGLDVPDAFGRAARERIARLFPKDARERNLLSLMENLISKERT